MSENQPIPRSPATRVVASPPGRLAPPPDPCAMVIFGATGDLTKRLVMPALYNLSLSKMLPEKFALIGVARAEETAESWRDSLRLGPGLGTLQ
jgi:glucose-6-phosphate 1-dehydrogenase